MRFSERTQEWLTKVFNVKGDGAVSDLFKPLKKIRRERQNPAHKINENQYDKQYIDKQKEIINEAYSVFRNLRNIFVLKRDSIPSMVILHKIGQVPSFLFLSLLIKKSTLNVLFITHFFNYKCIIIL